MYARAVPDHPQLAAALRPILTRELGRLCQLAIDQAATETDRKVILGDATLAAGLARWVTVTEVETNALIDAVDLMPPRSDLVVNPLAWCSPPCSPSDFGG